MGSTSGSLLLCLSIFILFSSVSCRPQKQNNATTHHNVNHIYHNATKSNATHFVANPTAIHLSKPTALAIYDAENTTVIRPLDSNDYCPRDAMKMHCCVDLFENIVDIITGKPNDHPCCSALFGLIDLEAAMCLCTTIRAKILGITIDLPIKMTLLLNYCNKPVPKGFICK